MSGSNSKLSSALKEAAFENIGEDIQEVHKILREILDNFPLEVKNKTDELQKNIEALSFALNAVPDKFNLDFYAKINRILEVTADFEHSANQHKKELSFNLERLVNDSLNDIDEQLSNKFKNSFFLKKTSLIYIVFFSSLFGGLIGAASIATFIYYNL